ncbi:MAG TPA: methionyl-tRNA formyltransferase [Lachnospiraceae bacterium]|nr:methionyl-tRNA formyltransferase [Lachnospiraceae bacterium]
MKIIFMGTPDFAVFTLDELNKAGHDIELIITQPDKPRGRSGKLLPSPVKSWAIEHDIEVYQPKKIKDRGSIDYLKKYDVDIMVVAAFGQILPKEILEMPTYGCINVHASLLPKYRGAAPIQWAILNGEDKTGVTIMQMGVGLDDGDILLTREVELDGTETGGSLFDNLATIGARACVETIDRIEDITPIPQDENEATHVGMINKSLGLINWNDSASKIERYVRGLNPWPSAYTSYKGKNLKIWKSRVVSEREITNLDIDLSQFTTGLVCFVNKKSLYVKTGDGILSLEEIQLEGKKRMDISSFLLGNKILPGEELGL